MLLRGTVKNVTSTDLLVVKGPPGPGGTPQEKTLRLRGIANAGRVGTAGAPDDAFAFESREYLIDRVLGKPVTFELFKTSAHSQGPANIDVASVYLDGEDIALDLLSKGWARAQIRSADDNDAYAAELRDAEDSAKQHSAGVWGSPAPYTKVDGVPEGAEFFVLAHKGHTYDAFVEAVLNGTTYRVRVFLPETEHRILTVAVAGARSPRAGASPEPLGPEARLAAETCLLQNKVKVEFLATGGASDDLLVGNVIHPSGNIAALLLSRGLAVVVDWHASFLAAPAHAKSYSAAGGSLTMQQLRHLEAGAKAKRFGVWKDLPAPSGNAVNGAAAAPATAASPHEATVVRVWSADSISIVTPALAEPKRIYLSSLRAPAASQYPNLAAAAKEALRQKLIGKKVALKLDFVRPPEGDFDKRDCYTVQLRGAPISHWLIEKGFVRLIRYKQGETQRAADYDDLLGLEAAAASHKVGVHADKDIPEGPFPARIVDASENAQRANSFIAGFKRAHKIAGIVDHVVAGSRFRILVPRQNLRLTLVLSGVRSPRYSAASAEPYGKEAYLFSTTHYLQRDIEFSVESIDRIGSFVGDLHLKTKSDSVAESLLENGLATADSYASDALVAIQDRAKAARVNIWKDYTEPNDDAPIADAPFVAAPAIAAPAPAPAPAARPINGPVWGASRPAVAPPAQQQKFLDVQVTHVQGDPDTPFAFSLQYLPDRGVANNALESLMASLKNTPPAPPAFAPKNNQLLACESSDKRTIFRAKVLKARPNKALASVQYIDYGFRTEVPFSRLRPLPPGLDALPPQSFDATLAYVRLIGFNTDYGRDAILHFESIARAGPLVASLLGVVNGIHIVVLYPLGVSPAPSASINVRMVSDGFARAAPDAPKHPAFETVAPAIREAADAAHKNHAGAYEFGDPFDE